MSRNAFAGLKLGVVMALGIVSLPAAAGLITAMRSQPPDESDPIVRLERDGIARNDPAPAEQNRRYWHNGSIVEASYSADGGVRISYVEPKPDLPATLRGMTLFEGRIARDGRLFGTAYTFKSGCAPAPYQVAGSSGPTGMTLSGASPRRDPYSCAVAGYTFRSPNVRLNFIDLT
jgi:hypothetical protein